MFLPLTVLMTTLTFAAASPTPWTEIETPTYHGVIVPAETGGYRGLDRAGGAAITGAWTPDRASVEALEAGLVAYLKEAAPRRSPALYAKVGPYKRQWGGVIVEGGRKLVTGSFMCRAPEGWRRSLLRVSDGGDCYFEVVFDPATKTFSDLYVHGEA